MYGWHQEKLDILGICQCRCDFCDFKTFDWRRDDWSASSDTHGKNFFTFSYQNFINAPVNVDIIFSFKVDENVAKLFKTQYRTKSLIANILAY